MRKGSGSLASAKSTCNLINLSQVPLPLTEPGKMLLSVFSQEAIDDCVFYFRNQSYLYNPFGYFYTMCLTHSKVNNLPINWQLLYKLKKQYRILHDTPMTKKESL